VRAQDLDQILLNEQGSKTFFKKYNFPKLNSLSIRQDVTQGFTLHTLQIYVYKHVDIDNCLLVMTSTSSKMNNDAAVQGSRENNGIVDMGSQVSFSAKPVDLQVNN
jgi:hypothetical protein